MATHFIITNAVRESLVTKLGVEFDAGTAAMIEIWEGTEPALPTTAITDGVGGYNLLAELLMSATAFASYTNGVATAAAIANDSSANKTGTAAFFRIFTQSAGTVLCQGTVGTASADLILNTVSITAGSTVSITAMTITMPSGA